MAVDAVTVRHSFDAGEDMWVHRDDLLFYFGVVLAESDHPELAVTGMLAATLLRRMVDEGEVVDG